MEEKNMMVGTEATKVVETAAQTAPTAEETKGAYLILAGVALAGAAIAEGARVGFKWIKGKFDAKKAKKEAEKAAAAAPVAPAPTPVTQPAEVPAETK